MRKAPAGAIVSLHVDLRERVSIGDTIETESGRRYAVIAVREQERGKHAGRQHLRCIVMGDRELLSGEQVRLQAELDTGRTHLIHWYLRKRKAKS